MISFDEPIYKTKIDLKSNTNMGPSSKKYGPGYVYLIKATDSNYCKIGISINPKRRLYTIDQTVPFDVELIHTMPVRSMKQCEDSWHYIFKKKRMKGEWFILDEDDIKLFCQCEGEQEQPLNIQIYWKNKWYWDLQEKGKA